MTIAQTLPVFAYNASRNSKLTSVAEHVEYMYDHVYVILFEVHNLLLYLAGCD